MSEFFDFEVYASDAAPVREVDQGHLVEVAWTVTAPTGAKSSGVKRVQITDDMDAVVQLGLLVTPDPIPGYTGGYALAPDLAAEVATRAAADTALDGRVDALEVAPPAHTHPLAAITDAGTAAAADVGDFATAAQGVLAGTASQPGHAHAGADITSGTVAYARLPVGTAASTVAAGDDSRITGAAQKSANLSDLASASTARTNLGLGDSAVVGALPIPDPGSFYPTDTITAALQLIGGRELYGTGSPEGVITAAVGTYYNDTAGTLGAWRWQKRTGAGNTGWVVTVGDTGWRDITSLLVNGWTGAAGSVLALRTADAVHVSFEALSGAAATAGTALTLPVGYRSRAGRSSRLLFHTATPALKRFLAYDSGIVAYNGTVPDASGANYGIGTFPAAPAWPTSLPGTAA